VGRKIHAGGDLGCEGSKQKGLWLLSGIAHKDAGGVSELDCQICMGGSGLNGAAEHYLLFMFHYHYYYV
jgi:hypothetical protein